jgi:hypothetical protein
MDCTLIFFRIETGFLGIKGRLNALFSPQIPGFFRRFDWGWLCQGQKIVLKEIELPAAIASNQCLIPIPCLTIFPVRAVALRSD